MVSWSQVGKRETEETGGILSVVQSTTVKSVKEDDDVKERY